jgi:hypothetical protein
LKIPGLLAKYEVFPIIAFPDETFGLKAEISLK